MTNASAHRLKVLWATDGSATAAGAVPMLREAVLPSAERLQILTVAPHSFLSGARPDPAFLSGVSAVSRRKVLVESEEVARYAADLLDGSDIAIEAVSRWGNPIEEILRAARSLPADLIVLGAKGHSNLTLLLLGSVAQGVVQNSTRPVLIARPGSEQIRSILIGFDGTTPARRALEFLDRLTLSQGVAYTLAHVIEPFAVPLGTPVSYRRQALAEAHRINERQHRTAERGLNAMAEKLQTSGRKVNIEVATGPAGPELDLLARNLDADLIVVGSRKPSPQSHYLLGSTAEKLVRHSHTSVLVVR